MVVDAAVLVLDLGEGDIVFEEEEGIIGQHSGAGEVEAVVVDEVETGGGVVTSKQEDRD